MTMTDTADAAYKAASAATYGGAGTAAVFGLSSSEWQALGVIGGILIGIVGVVVKGWLDYHFKKKHYELERLKLFEGD